MAFAKCLLIHSQVSHRLGLCAITARSMMPRISSQLSRNCWATAFWLAAFNQAMAKASNKAVNREPASAHGSAASAVPLDDRRAG
jgi:hypothetical protein